MSDGGDGAPRRVARRQWLAALAPAAADLAREVLEAGSEPAPEPQRRPPGALADEAAFLAACTRCHECVKACPHDAIHYVADSAGPPLAGTPLMRPESRACHMCEGFPCAAACPEPALSVPETPLWPLGKVRLDTTTCLAFLGPECGACVGLCPGDANALTLRRDRPLLDPDRCVGCGLCIEACVTSPASIELLPLTGP